MIMKYIKLDKYNNWGSEGYSIHKNDIKFKEGEVIHVKWKDGSETKEIIKHKIFEQSIKDSGRKYNVISNLAGVEIDYKGIKIWLSLDNVQVGIKQVKCKQSLYK